MRLEVTNQKSADEILNYFNSFHDGFIKRIEIASQDYFKSADSQIMTREFIITIDFCHHNYQNRYDNYTQVVRAIFRGVSLFSLNTYEFKEGEWCICDMQ